MAYNQPLQDMNESWIGLAALNSSANGATSESLQDTSVSEFQNQVVCCTEIFPKI